VTGEYAAAFLAASGPSVGVAVAAWASYQFQSTIVGLLIGMPEAVNPCETG
jgi:hypothetical protein